MDSIKFIKDFINQTSNEPKGSIPDKFKATLLGIGPMSELVIRSAIELGRDLKFPVIFILSRNQIDSKEFGGGYVKGWEQKDFSDFINKVVEETNFDGVLLKCRDHGGPWQRDEEKNNKIPEKDAIEIAKRSYFADLMAGFELLHIDPTKNPHLKGDALQNKIIEHTVELIEFIEIERKKHNLKEILYEVGTEDIQGGHTSTEKFKDFIITINRKLKFQGLPTPSFIVGQTGTLLKMRENVGTFDKETASSLCNICREFSIGFKEHNTDYLDEALLKEHPSIGITAANVAPEFGHAETIACLKLAEKEKGIIPFNPPLLKGDKGGLYEIATPYRARNDSDERFSNFEEVLRAAVLKTDKWKKWMPDDKLKVIPLNPPLEKVAMEDLIKDKKLIDEIVKVCGHYVIDVPEVAMAREKLFKNLKDANISPSPEEEIKDAIKDSIKKYVVAFNLQNSV